MAQIVALHGDRPPARHPLFRQTTTVGSDEGCDIPLKGAGIRPLHAEIRLEGSVHVVMPLDRDAEVLVNGRKVKQARLQVWDVLRVGSVTLLYASDDLPLEARDVSEKQAFSQLESLCDFSRRLMEIRDLDRVLGVLLDETLALTKASKGLLIFVEQGQPRVKVARNVDRKDLPGDEALFSESIVQKALAEGQPQLVSDALHNKEFSACTSVINLRLASVMCVPLKVGGETLGALYLGTERFLDLFDHVMLKTLMIYAAQAAVIVQHVQFLESLERDNARQRHWLARFRRRSIVGQRPAEGGPQGLALRVPDRLLSRDAGGLQPHPARGPDGRTRADPGRDRDRQGTGRARDPRP